MCALARLVMERADVHCGSADSLSSQLHFFTPREEALMKIYRKFHTHAIKGTFLHSCHHLKTASKEHSVTHCIIHNHQLHSLVLSFALISFCYLSVIDCLTDTDPALKWKVCGRGVMGNLHSVHCVTAVKHRPNYY